MVELHKLLGKDHFERLCSARLSAQKTMLDLLSNGRGDTRYCYQDLLRGHWDNGCIALILEKGDEEARENFRKAAEYASLFLKTPGGLKGPRTFEAHLEVSPEGVRPIAIHEKPPPPEGSRLAIHEYSLALMLIAAFGERQAIREAAWYPEEGYRSSEVIAGEDYFALLRAYKAWLLEDEATAKSEAMAVLPRSQAVVRPEVAAFLSMATGDAEGFRKNLGERLKTHKKQWAKHPNMPKGVVCLPGLMLCRMAFERGIALEDQPYLPVRLLPNCKPSVH